MATAEQAELIPRGAVTSVRVHQETNRESRLYELEFTDGVQVWREPLWSVTTLLKGIDKPGIPRWAAKGVATEAIDQRQYLEADVKRYGRDEAIDQLSQAPYRVKSRAGDIGTGVHTLIDAHIRGAEAPPVDDGLRDEIVPRFEQFLRWEQAYRPTYHGAEMTVYHPEHGWAGTLDTLVEIGTVAGLGLIDFKNTNPAGRKKDQPGVWMEHALQCSAYRHALTIVAARGAWVEPVPMPEVTWGAVLWLARDRHALVEVDVGPDSYRAFQIAAELWRYMDGAGKRAVLAQRTPATFGILPTPDEQAAAVRVISEEQRRRMLAIGAKAGLDHAGVKATVHKLTGVGSTKLVPLSRYDEVCAVLEGRPTEPPS